MRNTAAMSRISPSSAVPSFKAFPQIDGTPTNTVIAINFEQRLCIIGNTGYAGEIKKSDLHHHELPAAARRA